jgi:hypothetical protein
MAKNYAYAFITAAAMLIGYIIMMLTLELLRTNAGVAPDTGTPIDVFAWLGCIFAAATMAGITTDWISRSTGIQGIVGVFLFLGIGIAVHLDESVSFDGFIANFGHYTLPILSWIALLGIVSSWRLSANQAANKIPWFVSLVFLCVMVTLVIVFYPAEKYFMGTWG